MNKKKKGNNIQLILILAASALLIGWCVYQNWDSDFVRKVRNLSGIDAPSLTDSTQIVLPRTATFQTVERLTNPSANPPAKAPEKIYASGKYTGKLKNNIPEGDGKMTYNRRVQIAKHDTEHPPHYAESGDYFIGSWGNGDIVSGSLYDRNGNVKEKILAPKRFNPYDINKD
jgi:hypothetical protein